MFEWPFQAQVVYDIECFNLYSSKSFGSPFNKIAQKYVQVISGIELNNETLRHGMKSDGKIKR